MSGQALTGSRLEESAPAEQAQAHLGAVLPAPLLPFESIEIRCLDTRTRPAKPGPRLFVDSIEAAVEAAMRHRDDWDVFFGVGTRTCPSAISMTECRHAGKGADHVSRLEAMWGDFDVKEGAAESMESIVTRLSSLSLPPLVLVGSGRGLHAYWPLLEPTQETGRIEALNRGLRLRFGADNAVDAARILRVAGTLNHKYGEPLPVQLLRAD